MKPVARREDVAEAVEAARTAWILTDVDRVCAHDTARRDLIGRTRPSLASNALLIMYPCLRSLARRSRKLGRG